MPKFEKNGTDFVYTDQYGGALYFNGAWLAFRYFDDGSIDVLDEERFATYGEAFNKYKSIYT